MFDKRPHKTDKSFAEMAYKLQLFIYTHEQLKKNHYRFLKRKITGPKLCFRKVMSAAVGFMLWVEETREAQRWQLKL